MALTQYLARLRAFFAGPALERGWEVVLLDAMIEPNALEAVLERSLRQNRNAADELDRAVRETLRQ